VITTARRDITLAKDGKCKIPRGEFPRATKSKIKRRGSGLRRKHEAEEVKIWWDLRGSAEKALTEHTGFAGACCARNRGPRRGQETEKLEKTGYWV